MKILNDFNNIEKNISRNNYTVIGLIVLMCLMIVCFTVYVFKTATYFSNSQIVLESTGEIRKIHRVSPMEALEIEAKDHMARLYGTLYTFDQFNLDKQINAGLWLGDESLRKLYERYKNDGWYNNIIQYNIVQTAEVGDIRIDLSVYPYKVYISGVILLRQADKVEKFSLNGSCVLETASRDFPKNPHGLFIRNWIEEPLKKIE